jgi:uncharacterized protein (UPF0254 family)
VSYVCIGHHITNGYDDEQIKECYDLAMKMECMIVCEYMVLSMTGVQFICVYKSNGILCAELSVAFLGGLDDMLST